MELLLPSPISKSADHTPPVTRGQSANHTPPELERRVDAILTSFRDTLETMEEDELSAHIEVCAVLSRWW